jgi:hypothetical protein
VRGAGRPEALTHPRPFPLPSVGEGREPRRRCLGAGGEMEIYAVTIFHAAGSHAAATRFQRVLG